MHSLPLPLSLLVVLALSAGNALAHGTVPPPRPTPVITGLGTHYAGNRYYSTLRPFSVVCPWHGATFHDAGTSFDRFTAPIPGRVLDVLVDRNGGNVTAGDIVGLIAGSVERDGGAVWTAGRVRVAGVWAGVYRMEVGPDSGAFVLALVRGWVVMFELVSTGEDVGWDVALARRCAGTFRFEHGA